MGSNNTIDGGPIQRVTLVTNEGDPSYAPLQLSTGDIEIGAVELKNGTDDTRATVTAGNALKVDLSATAVNSTAIKVDGSAVTQPVSSAAVATGGYSYAHIAAGQATTVVKASAGTLHSITLNSAAAATNITTVYDHASSSGTVIAIPSVVTATVPTTLLFDVAFGTGLTIITTTANGGDMTVAFK